MGFQKYVVDGGNNNEIVVVSKSSIDSVGEAIKNASGISDDLTFPSGFIEAIYNIPTETRYYNHNITLFLNNANGWSGNCVCNIVSADNEAYTKDTIKEYIINRGRIMCSGYAEKTGNSAFIIGFTYDNISTFDVDVGLAIFAGNEAPNLTVIHLGTTPSNEYYIVDNVTEMVPDIPVIM